MPLRRPHRAGGVLLLVSLAPLLASLHEVASLGAAFLGQRRRFHEPRLGGWLPHVIIGLLLAICISIWRWWQSVLYARELHRPYRLDDTKQSEEDPKAEFNNAVVWIQETLIRPIDQRLPGRPFKNDFYSVPATPTVLVLGNHSAGKSTLINQLLGVNAQETGVAPVDDGFTVLERAPKVNQFEDGPTLLSCPDNRAFRELQQFGPGFTGHFKRKRLKVPDTATLPYGMQLVDSPGMMDTPCNAETSARARGYNFVEVVRWWAKRADLILFFFDPHKPGTSGETLSVLTQSLQGLDHKLLIVLNKADQLDSNMDLAHVFATLGWSLSKVIPRKDVPVIYAMHNAGFGTSVMRGRDTGLPLQEFERRREEVIEEIQHVKARHWDNVITALDETLRQTAMVATITAALRWRILERRVSTAVGLTLVWIVVTVLIQDYCRVQGVSGGGILLVDSVAALLCAGTIALLRLYLRQHQQFLLTRLDVVFEEAYSHFFIHADGEDLRARWVLVRPKVVSILKSVPSPAALDRIAEWEIRRIDVVLNEDMLYLRTLALRETLKQIAALSAEPDEDSDQHPGSQGHSRERSREPLIRTVPGAGKGLALKDKVQSPRAAACEPEAENAASDAEATST